MGIQLLSYIEEHMKNGLLVKKTGRFYKDTVNEVNEVTYILKEINIQFIHK